MLRTVVLGSTEFGEVLGFSNFDIQSSLAWLSHVAHRALGGKEAKVSRPAVEKVFERIRNIHRLPGKKISTAFKQCGRVKTRARGTSQPAHTPSPFAQ